MEGLMEGRVVHYVSYNGKHQAAIVTGTYGSGPATSEAAPTSVADLAVFWNIPDTAGHPSGGLSFHFGVQHSDDLTPGTWHWFGNQKGAAHA